MPLEDISNKPPKFRLHVDLEREYATLRSSRSNEDTNVALQTLRLQGQKCIDLWTDGCIYPLDPITNAPPPFSNVTTFLRFLGDGASGLLGYCRRLHVAVVQESCRRAHVEGFFHGLQQKNKEEINRLNNMVAELESQRDQLSRALEVAKIKYDEECTRADAVKQDAQNMRRHLASLKKLPLSFCQRKRKRQCLENLATFSGARKRRLRATRNIAGEMMGCEAGATAAKAGLLKHVVKLPDILKLLEDPSIAKIIRDRVFTELQHMVSPLEIMDACDSGGVSRKGYEAIYRVFTLAHRAKGVLRPMLPTPFSVTMAQKCANEDVASMLGGYRYVKDAMPVSTLKCFEYNEFNNVYIDVQTLQRAMITYYGLTYEECQGQVVFVLKLDECQIVKGRRLERVSLTLMNRALKSTPEQVENEQIDSMGNKDKEYYGVQSEKNIWWMAAFELPHESHDTLRWYLSRSGIPDIISLQTGGQLLDVEGLGTFAIEWHMAGNLKTLKCMLGCKLGANTLYPCIYCCHSKSEAAKGGKSLRKTVTKATSKSRKDTGNIVQNKGPKKSMQWVNGILSCNRRTPPNRDQLDDMWNPILDIPLSRIHICTLHARLRIMDKLLKLHINYAWNMEPEDLRKKCIEELEEALSSVGLHGGVVTITKDSKKSGKGQDNPNKICMGGSKARHLLSNHNGGTSHTSFEIWKRICDCTTYRGNDAELGLKRARPWESLDTMIPLLEKARLCPEEITALKNVIHTFTEQIVEAWGETHITHYMVCISSCFLMVISTCLMECFLMQHIIFAHAPFFLDAHGTLAIWSTQGMERSHYQAKAAYFKNTRHGGGGKEKSNSLHEMFNWFFRTLGGRSRQKTRGPCSLLRKVVKNVNQRRVTAWQTSTAMQQMRNWFSARRRCGKRWVLR